MRDKPRPFRGGVIHVSTIKGAKMRLEARIIHETNIGYVFKVKKDYFEVRINRYWDSISDSAYTDASLAIARLNYLTTRKQRQ